jgi:hypothetical protein
MALCSINKSLLRKNICGYQLNDVTAIYLANFSDISATSVGNCDGEEDGQMVTAITLATGAKWAKIEPARNSGAYSDTLNVTDGGAKYRTHQVSFSFNGTYDCNMPDIVDALSLGRYIAIVKLANGNSIMLGRVAGIEAETVTVGGEAGPDNASGIEVVLNGNQAESALPVSEGAMAVVEAHLYE